MAITTFTHQQIGPNLWRFDWLSDEETPTYYVYIDGRLAQTTTKTWMQITIDAGEYVQVDVFDDADTVPDPAYPARAYVTWDGDSNAAYYRIDQYVDSAWTQVGKVRESGQSNYRWLTAALDDDTEHTFRVVPLGANDLEGLPREITIFMIRRPDAPSVAYTYSAVTGKITIAEA